MTGEQALAFGILAATFVLFVWGRWRYDVVAVVSLLVAVGVDGVVGQFDHAEERRARLLRPPHG